MKIQLPIDTSAVPIIDAMPLGPVLDRQTKQQRADANGEPPYSIELVPIVAEGGRVLNVQIPGHSPGRDPAGMPQWRATGLKR
jgi:hypothetical protein